MVVADDTAKKGDLIGCVLVIILMSAIHCTNGLYDKHAH